MTGHRTLLLVTVATGALLLGGCRGGSVADAPATPTATPTATSAATSAATPAARPDPDTDDVDEIEARLDRLEREIETDGER